MQKEKLIAYLIVKSVNDKNVPLDYKDMARELRTKPMDLRLMINYLHNQGELKYWEELGIEYVNLFGI